MRMQLLLLIGIFCGLSAQSQQKKQAVDSKIERVTVFLQGAQVNRSAKTTIGAGKTELVFGNISPQIDKQSIQVKAEGKITILSVIHQLNYLKEQETREEIKNLDLQKQSLQEKVAAEKNQLTVFKQEESLLLKNQDIKGAQSTLKASELKEAADFQRARLTEVYTRISEIEKDIKKFETENEKINNQLRALNEKKNLSTSELLVTVTAKEATSANFQVSYLVKKASWYPTYDIRVKDINSPINLECKANVSQQSGEDWKDIKLSLSSGNPGEDGTRPTLYPFYLHYISAEAAANISKQRQLSSMYGSNTFFGKVTTPSGEPVPYASVIIKGSKTAATTNNEGFFSLPGTDLASTLVVTSVGYESVEVLGSRGYMSVILPESVKQLQEVVVTGYSTGNSSYDYSYDKSSNYKRKKDESAITTTTSYQPTTTVYDIEEAYTVLNDGKTYTADIASYEMKADYEYYAAPKVAAEAYLTARVTDWQELNLLPGEANLFFEGTFLGKSLLDVANAGDTLNLSLGKDKGVVVKRTLLKEYSQKKFLGSNRTDSRQYEITVRNNKSQPIHITIEDQFPISTTKEIEVDDKTAKDARVDENTQKITWLLTVETKKEEKRVMGYSVKYPKERKVAVE